MSSFVVVKKTRGITVAYLKLNKVGNYKWVIKRDDAYRFPSVESAQYFTYGVSDTDVFEIERDTRTPSTEVHANLWRKSRAAPKPEPVGYIPLAPYRMTTGQRVTLSLMVVLFALFIVSLVAGW